MRKLSKKISMLMVLAMLVGLFSGVVSASAASAWSFASSKYDVAVNGSINMESKEYADFDLLKDGKAPAGYTVAWASSDEDVVWVNAKTGQLRANKFGKAADGDKAVISATFTNTATKKSATRSFTIVLGAAKADYTVEAADVTIALGEEVKFAPVVKDAAGKTVKFATHKSYNGYFLDGKAIANPWTPEEAGEYTVTVAQFAKKANVADLAKAVRKTEVKVTVTVDDFTAKATKVKEITVYGDFAKDAKFSIKKNGNQNISFAATVAEDGKSATLALTSKLSKGTYTVACGDAKVDLAIDDEKVKDIVILENGGMVYTDADKVIAYAHVDVINQYDESILKSVDVQWSTSAGKAELVNRNTGLVHINAVSGDTFTYGDPVVLTGIVVNYNNTTKSTTANMTIGLENDINSVKVLGVSVDLSSELKQEVPADFNNGTYYLVFACYDRAGNIMTFNPKQASEGLTFTSVSPLLIKEIKKASPFKTVYIDGIAYGAVELVQGIQAKQGGVADIKITSSKTGYTTPYSLRVVSGQILESFSVIRPDSIVSKTAPWGGNIDLTLGFEALDVNGDKITDFRALTESVSFSDKNVTLREENDGSASLHLQITDDCKPSKEVDIPIVFSAIVPRNGNSDNVTIYVKQARMANAVTTYGGTNEILEGDSINIDLRDFRGHTRDGWFNFIDQYDTALGHNSTFAGTYVGIKTIGDATGFNIGTTGTDCKYVDTFDDYKLFDASKGSTVTFSADPLDLTDDVKEVIVEVALYDVEEKKMIGGSDSRFVFKIVDLSQVVSFYVGATNPLMENNLPIKDKAGNITGYGDSTSFYVKGKLANGHEVDVNSIAGVTGAAVITYKAESWFKGNNVAHFDASNKVWADYDVKLNSNGSVTAPVAGGVTGDALYFIDMATKNADGTNPSKDLGVNVTATITVDGKQRDKVSTNVGIGIYQRLSKTITAAGNAPWPHSWVNVGTDAIVKAKEGVITYEDLVGFVGDVIDNYGEHRWSGEGVEITISKLAEGAKGVRKYDLTLANNAVQHYKTKNAKGEWYYPEVKMIEGAEIGDTFTVTYAEHWIGASLTINFTVGSDREAKFNDANTLPYYR